MIYRGYTYLASPFTHKDPLVREMRFLAAEHATNWLLQNRVWTYSPIVHCHSMAKTYNLPHDAAFWDEYDKTMLSSARDMLVLRYEGWEKSKGVTSEIEFADQIKKPRGWIYLKDGTYIREWETEQFGLFSA